MFGSRDENIASKYTTKNMKYTFQKNVFCLRFDFERPLLRHRDPLYR